MGFRVGGLISRTNTFVDWPNRLLEEGDEVRIVVCTKQKTSKPKKSRTETEKNKKKRKLEHLKWLSKELGYSIKKNHA